MEIMKEFIEYIFFGCIHYLNILLGMFDFKDLGFIWIVIIGFIILFILNKDVRDSFIELVKTILLVSKSIPGLIFLLLFISYYIYVAIAFEEKITFALIIVSIYLLVQTYLRLNMDLLATSDNSILDTIKEFSLPVFILCIQQILAMLEANDFNNIKFALLSLLVIPIFSFLFILFKHFINFDDFYKRNVGIINMDDFHFFKIYNDSLIQCKSYKINDISLEKFIKSNYDLDYEEMKYKIKKDLKKYIIKENKTDYSKEIKNKSKVFKFFHNMWILNIIALIIDILVYRFYGEELEFLYYWTYFITLIYFWYDLMKIKKIENQFDFVMYMFIYIILIIFLVIYHFSLKQSRLTELAFLIPILIFIRMITYYKDFPNLLKLSFLSEKNFFGLHQKETRIQKKDL